MTNDDQLKNEKMQYDINEDVASMISMNILQAKKYYLLIKNK